MKPHWFLFSIARVLAGTVKRFFLVASLTLYLLFFFGASAFAVWQVDFESKSVDQGATGVTVNVTAYWDLKMGAFTVPVIVRSISGGAFWTPPLPSDYAGNPVVGVQWNWFNPGWANLVEQVLPGLGCDPAGDVGYDGVSPDHFVVSAASTGPDTPAEPNGRDVLTLTIDVNGNVGDFEFDTACFVAPLNTIYMIDNVNWQDHGPTGIGDFNGFNKGVISIPPGNQAIRIESKTVPTGSVGVQVGIRIANDDPLQRITLPLVCRNVTGGAFWTNVPAGLDTLPWEGRLTSALTHSRTLDKSEIDGVSPDLFLLEAQNDGDPALAPGPLEKMITLVFDVGDDGGSFEIDTALFPPGLGLEVETPGDPGLVITPGFTKGIITATLPDTGNRVEISSISVQAKKPNVPLQIRITTTTPVRSISIPLTARSVTGNAFWAADFDTITWAMTPPGALSYTRLVIRQLNFDYSSPDDFLIKARALDDPCLDAGEHPAFVTLRFTLNNNPGTFEIDTVMIPPSHTLYFGLCDRPGGVKPSFIKGIVTIEPCDCSLNGDVNCDGEINPLDAVTMVNYIYYVLAPALCDPGNCFQNGDLDCDGGINPVDMVYLVNFVYMSMDMICDPCTM